MQFDEYTDESEDVSQFVLVVVYCCLVHRVYAGLLSILVDHIRFFPFLLRRGELKLVSFV